MSQGRWISNHKKVDSKQGGERCPYLSPIESIGERVLMVEYQMK